MDELVSVIIPTYNRKNTIMKATKSVLNQTYKNIEVIIVDDASTDGTENLFKENIDKRVRFYRYTENKGACYARNYGVEHANGRYIAFQDSDDEWLDEKIEKQLKYLKQKNADFVFCGMNRTSKNKKFYYPERGFDNNKDAFIQILDANRASTQTMLMKKEIFETIKFDILFKRFQDWDFALQVAKNGYKMYYLEEALVDSEVQANSISLNGKTADAFLTLINKYKEDYNANSVILSKMFTRIAQAYKRIDKKECRHYLKKSLKIHFNFKTFIKLTFSYLNIY